ncbi:helix-turn-helix domain-containing protein [Mycobacteroides sp. PCS013]|uniref:helix-turn-helix domain-containing protein n=1 Tax=Mycobacteroides sp. PCS013 TaxID=3074106 RepID=UPI003C2F3F15
MEGQLQKIVGRNLRRYRKERGLSQEAFADHVGVHRTYMGAVERGERNLTLQSLERMADILEIDARELLAKPEKSASSD